MGVPLLGSPEFPLSLDMFGLKEISGKSHEFLRFGWGLKSMFFFELDPPQKKNVILL